MVEKKTEKEKGNKERLEMWPYVFNEWKEESSSFHEEGKRQSLFSLCVQARSDVEGKKG